MRRLIALVPLVLVAAIAACGKSSANNECEATSGAKLQTCAMGTTIRGVDVSTFDNTVDWTKAKAAGMQFGIARISDGTAHPDDQFTANWQAMKAQGLVRGAYQYFRASVDANAQVALVMSSLTTAGGLETGDLPVVLDLETADGQSEATVQAQAKIWLDAIEAQIGRKPIIYTSEGTYPLTTDVFAGYPLWVANYGAKCPEMPVGWTQWIFFQDSATGTVDGVGTGTVDTDQFNGTLADLLAFANPSDGGATDGGGSSSSSSGSSSGSQPVLGDDAGSSSGASSSGTSGNPCP